MQDGSHSAAAVAVVAGSAVSGGGAGDAVPLSLHARQRCARRGIAPEAVLLACEHGRLVRTAGASFFFVGRREAAAASAWGAARPLAERCVGLVVLVAGDGSVITAYKNARALEDIRRKRRFDRRPRQPAA